MDPQQYLSGLLMGTADFELLAAELLNQDNARRTGAETMFSELKKQSPDAALTYLIKTLRSSPVTEHKSLGAVMIRRVLTKEEPSLWTTCSEPMQATIKQELMAAVQQEQTTVIQKQVADALAELASYLLALDVASWPEFLPFLYQQLQTTTGHALECALTMLSELGPVLSDAAPLRAQLGGVMQLLAQHLQNPSKDIQTAALNAATSMILCLEEHVGDQNRFQAILPAMIAVVSQFDDEDLERTGLELFIEIADRAPKFLKSQLQNLVVLMLGISEEAKLEAETRMLAAEFLLTLCESGIKARSITQALRKMPDFTERMYLMLMMFLLDMEDDPQWHTSETEATEDAGEGELACFGQESLDRLAIAMGGKALVPYAGALLGNWLQDPNWVKRFATLICLAQITEGCQKVMLENKGIMDRLVDMCLKGLQDPHPRVRWASCQALGQMCSDLGPMLQDAQHARILPALVAAMDDVSSPRVQAHATAAIVNFAEQCEKEVMEDYLHGLIGKLLQLLVNPSRIVQEGALTALASVADASQDYFIQYYDHVMPRLIQILLGANDKSHRLLRAKALECISLVAMSVGRKKFHADALTVFDFMRRYNLSAVDSDDPITAYMLQAGARICKCLKEEMVPYLDIVMPQLLKSASLPPDVKVRSSAEVGDDQDDGDYEHVEVGDKVLTIRTSTLDEKGTACSMLCCYAEELKGAFQPYVTQVANLMVPLLTFYFHEQVRRSAAQSLPCLVTCALRACERNPQLVPGTSNEDYIRQFVAFLWDPLLKATEAEPDVEIQAAQLEAIAELVKVLEAPYVTDQMVHGAFELFKGVLAKVEERRAERIAELDGEGELDEDAQKTLDNEQADDEELADSVSTGIGYFLRKFGDRVMPFVEPLVLTFFAPMLDPKRGGDERRIAACVLDDILEHSELGRQKYLQTALPMLLSGVQDKHHDLRQCCAYGLKVAASLAGPAFKQVAVPTVHVLLGLIAKPDAREGDNALATENAVSALGAIIEHHADLIHDPKVVSAWLMALPLEDDYTEAMLMHELLVKMLEAQDPRLTLDAQHVAHIVQVMVKVLGHGTDLVKGPVGLRMAALLRHMQSSIPADMVPGLVQHLSPFEQQHWQTYMEGRVPEDDDE